MNTHHHTGLPNIHSYTADALVGYLRDCKMKASDLVSMNLALALEYVYRPELRFWRDFEISFVTDALDQHLPDYVRPSMKRQPTRLKTWSRRSRISCG